MIPDQHYELLKVRWAELAKFAEGMANDPTHISLEPMPGEIRARITPLERLAHFVDPILAEEAAYVQARTGYTIADRYSNDQLSGAIDGNLLHEINTAADMVRDQMLEAAE